MTDNEVHGELVEWIKGVINAPVIRAFQGGPTPGPRYVMVNYTGSQEVRVHPSKVEYLEDDTTNSLVLATPVIETEWRFSVHSFGENPTDLLRPIRSASKLSQVEEQLRPRLTIHEVSQIRNLPESDGTRVVQRAQMDVYLRGLVRDGHLIDTINEFEPFDIGRKV